MIEYGWLFKETEPRFVDWPRADVKSFCERYGVSMIAREVSDYWKEYFD